MTYTYKRPLAKRSLLKPAVAVIAAALLATITFNIMAGPTSKPTPLATQPAAFNAPTEEVKAPLGIQDKTMMVYRDVDNKIRDVQMDNAILGRKIKNTIESDRNPVRSALVQLDRRSSLWAILVGLAFLFTMISFGFIRTSKDPDLSNF